MSRDARKNRRKQVFFMTVRYRTASRTEFIEERSHDVSVGGTFVRTEAPLPPGTLLKIELHLASHPRAMAGVGRVVWTRKGHGLEGAVPDGMGIKFVKIDSASRELIARLA